MCESVLVICCLGREVALGVQRCCQGVTCTCCQCNPTDDDKKGLHEPPKQPPACPIPSPYKPRLICSKGSTAPGAKKCCQWCCENCAAKNGEKAAKPKGLDVPKGCSPKEPCSQPCDPVEPNLPDSNDDPPERTSDEKALAETAAAEKEAAEKEAAEKAAAEKAAAEKTAAEEAAAEKAAAEKAAAEKEKAAAEKEAAEKAAVEKAAAEAAAEKATAEKKDAEKEYAQKEAADIDMEEEESDNLFWFCGPPHISETVEEDTEEDLGDGKEGALKEVKHAVEMAAVGICQIDLAVKVGSEATNEALDYIREAVRDAANDFKCIESVVQRLEKEADDDKVRRGKYESQHMGNASSSGFSVSERFSTENSEIENAVREAKRDVKKIEAAVLKFAKIDLEGKEKGEEQRCQEIHSLSLETTEKSKEGIS